MRFPYEITDEDKDEFLELLRQGLKPNQAARELDTTGSRMRKFRSEQSPYYDPLFAKQWAEVEQSAAYRRALEEMVRDWVYDSAEEGNWNARWKLALAHLPEFEWARHANLNVNMQMQVLTRALPALTMEERERVKEALADGEKPELRLLEAAEA